MTEITIDKRTQFIASGQAFAKDTKVGAFYDENNATAIVPSDTDITITPNSGTFSGGVIRAFTFIYFWQAPPSTA